MEGGGRACRTRTGTPVAPPRPALPPTARSATEEKIPVSRREAGAGQPSPSGASARLRRRPGRTE